MANQQPAATSATSSATTSATSTPTTSSTTATTTQYGFERQLLAQFVLVLDQTTHPGNLGQIARIAANMGINHVRLSAPKASIEHPDAVANSANATEWLKRFSIYPDLEAALADCQLIFATSARKRCIDARICAPEQILERTAQANLLEEKLVITGLDDFTAEHESTKHLPKIALVFGTESSGLSNEALLLANYHVLIDTNPLCSSLNVAMATLVITNALRQAVINLAPQLAQAWTAKAETTATQEVAGPQSEPGSETAGSADDQQAVLATSEQVQTLLKRYFKILERLEGQGLAIHQRAIDRIRRLAIRAGMEDVEVRLLHGVLRMHETVLTRLENYQAQADAETPAQNQNTKHNDTQAD